MCSNAGLFFRPRSSRRPEIGGGGHWRWVWLCWCGCGWLLRFRRCPGCKARGWRWSQWWVASIMTSRNTSTLFEFQMASIMTFTENQRVHATRPRATPTFSHSHKHNRWRKPKIRSLGACVYLPSLRPRWQKSTSVCRPRRSL